MAEAPRDGNFIPTALFESSTQPGLTYPGQIITATGRVKVDMAGGSAGTVTEINSGTGIKLTPDPITTTGSVALVDRIAPIATLGSALQQIRVNAGATALEYFTASGSTPPGGLNTQLQYNNSGAFGGITGAVSDGTSVSLTGAHLLSPTINGAGAGLATLAYPNTASNATITFPTVTGTLATLAGTEALTNKSYNGLTLTSTTGTFTLTNGKTLSVSNTLTFTGTDSSTVAFGAGGTVLYAASTIPLTVGSTTIASGTTTRILYDNAGVLGEYTLTGSGTVVAMGTSPVFTTGISSPQVLATANDSGALGASGTAFADLFLASGGVINWAANNSNITHSTGILTVGAGEFRITSANVGTNADSVPTLSSTSTLTNKTLTSPAITTSTLTGAQVLNENASLQLDPAGSADGKFTGITVTAVSDYTQAFGDLVYLKASNSRWAAADADAATTAGPVALAMVVVTGTSGNACTLLLQGIIRADAKFPAMTIGATQYVGEATGEIQGVIPTGADSVIRTVGYALTADELYFAPSTDWQISVA